MAGTKYMTQFATSLDQVQTLRLDFYGCGFDNYLLLLAKRIEFVNECLTLGGVGIF